MNFADCRESVSLGLYIFGIGCGLIAALPSLLLAYWFGRRGWLRDRQMDTWISDSLGSTPPDDEYQRRT